MGKALLERRLRDTSVRIKNAQRDLSIAEEQLTLLREHAEEARLRALVSETPLAEQEHRENERHADAMGRHCDDLRAELVRLERSQDALLDRLVAATP